MCCLTELMILVDLYQIFLSGNVVPLSFDKSIFIRIGILDLCANQKQKLIKDIIKSHWKDKLASTLHFSKI